MDLLGVTLFGRARYKVLAALFALPAASGVHLRELARRTGLSPTATQYELRLLDEAGLVDRDDSSGRALYRIRDKHPVAKDLRSILEKTSSSAKPGLSDSAFWKRKRKGQERDYQGASSVDNSPFLKGRYSGSAFDVDLGSR